MIGDCMRRRTLLVALAGLAVLVGLAVVVLWSRTEPDRITRQNYDRIVADMTQADVEAILGPPSDYRDGPTDNSPCTESALLRASRERPLASDYSAFWHGDAASIVVEITPDGDIMKNWCPSRIRGPLETLLWRAKRQWHRWFRE
jgi:hypothetical protein